MVRNSKNTNREIKDASLNVKIPQDTYTKLKNIADELGGMTLSTMIRLLIYSRIDAYEKTGNPKVFIDFNSITKDK